MYTILYLGTSQFSRMMNTERWQLTRGMLQEGYYFLDLFALQGKRIDLYDLWKEFREPDCIILEDYDWAAKLNLPLRYDGVNKVTVPIWAFIADYWYDPIPKRDYYATNHISGLISLHEVANEFIRGHFGDLVQQIINIPFSVDPDEFSSTVREKEYDVLCSGFMGDLYPLRRRVRDILKSNGHILTLFLDHPGYWKNEDGIGLQGRSYYNFMELSRFVLSTTGIRNISVRKHIEAVGAHAKIVGNITGFEEHGAISKLTLLLHPQMSDKEITTTIESACRNWCWSEEDETVRDLIMRTSSPTAIARLLKLRLASCRSEERF